MGLGQSSTKDEDVPPISSRFSSTELRKLEESFKPKESTISEEGDAVKWAFESIKARVSEAFTENVASRIISYIDSAAAEGEDIIPEQFLQVVFHLTKDSIKDLAQTMFNIVGSGDQIIKRPRMQTFLTEFVSCLSRGCSSSGVQFRDDEISNKNFAEKLVENCPENMRKADFDIALHRTPLLIDVLQHKFRLLFFEFASDGCQASEAAMPTLIPTLEVGKQSPNPDTFLLSMPDAVYINSKLPVVVQQKWRLLYSSKLHGESFSKMTGAMIGKGPSLIVVRDSNGHVFGGFASASWEYSSQFQGTDKSFLFSVSPSLEVYDSASGYNDHYMYLNVGQETMPNGLGMGGQHNFFGLWLDQEYGKGHSRAKPACTTFGSPQLSKEEEFKIEAVTVWGVGDEPTMIGEEDYDESMTSVLDKHVEAKALLEIAGKPRVSEGLRDIEPDADIPETKELQHAHDPMT